MNNRINPGPFSGVFDPAERIFLKTFMEHYLDSATIHPRSKLRGIRERCWINKKGITIIELVVVMIIIAIGAVSIAPNIGAWLPHYRLRSATRDIVSTMRTAQMKAVSANVEYRVYFDQTNRKFWLEKGNLSSNSTHWGTEGAKEGADNFLPSGISISYTSNFVEFNPNSTSSTGSITLSNTKNSTKRIVLHYTGRIRVE